VANGSNGRQNGQRTAIWQIGAAVLASLATAFTIMRYMQEPIYERLNSHGERLTQMATETSSWRSGFVAENSQRLAQLDALVAQRGAAMYDRLSATDTQRATVMDEFGRRLDAIERTSAANDARITEQVDRMREHLAALDKRLNDTADRFVEFQEARNNTMQRAVGVIQGIQDKINVIDERTKDIERQLRPNGGRATEKFGGPR
jgi:hypothetical protein